MARPTIYTKAFLKTAYDYIENCPDIVPTVVGLCLHIGIAKSTAYKWVDDGKVEFSDILEFISNLQERKLIEGGLTNEFNSAISKMMLTKHGYTDKIETDVTTKGKQINSWVINPISTKTD